MATETYPHEHVRSLRQSLGITQVELAERLGVSQALVAHWERGHRVPNGPAAILLWQYDRQAQKKSGKSS